MKIKKKKLENRYCSRRQFLVGAGQSMMFLPPLLSMMPKMVAAQVANQKKTRAVFYMGTLGISPQHLYPSDLSGMTTGTSFKTKYRELPSFSGPISRMIDSSFSSILPDMNLVEGLSMTGGKWNSHNRGVLSAIQSQGRSPSIGRSVDVVLEKYPGVYGTHVPQHKVIRIDHGSHQASFSHDGPVISSAIRGDLSLYNTLFAPLEGQQQQQGPSQSQLNKELVVDQVYADLKKLENHPRLSSSDKNLLQRYVANMFDLQQRVRANVSVGGECAIPNLNLEVDGQGNRYQFPQSTGWGIQNVDALFDNYIEMIRMAFICDLTRVFVIENDIWSSSPIPTGSQGGLHHECPSSETSADRHQYGLKKMAKLAEALRGTTDPHNSGNILDNSLVFWSNEIGDWTTGHYTYNMPVVTFGKLGGFFNTGYYVDYRNYIPRGNITDPQGTQRSRWAGRPMKQILQSIMLGMGVPKSEYIKYGDGSGFGEFKKHVDQFGHHIPDVYTAYENEHNDKLPFLT